MVFKMLFYVKMAPMVAPMPLLLSVDVFSY